MNQATVLDWLGIEAWRPRVTPSLFTASVTSTGQSAAPAGNADEILGRTERMSEELVMDQSAAMVAPYRSQDEEQAAVTGASESRENVDSEALARVVLLKIHDLDTPPMLFARIAQILPRDLSVRPVSADAADTPSLHWQGVDWRLSDLRQDSGLKRRLWRALCLPGQQVE